MVVFWGCLDSQTNSATVYGMNNLEKVVSKTFRSAAGLRAWFAYYIYRHARSIDVRILPAEKRPFYFASKITASISLRFTNIRTPAPTSPFF